MNSRAFRRWESRPNHASIRNSFLAECGSKVAEFLAKLSIPPDVDVLSEMRAYFHPHAVKFFLDTIFDKAILHEFLLCIQCYKPAAEFFHGSDLTKSFVQTISKVDICGKIAILDILQNSQDPFLYRPQMQHFWEHLFLLSETTEVMCVSILGLLQKCGAEETDIERLAAKIYTFSDFLFCEDATFEVETNFIASLEEKSRIIYLAKRMDFDLMEVFADCMFVRKLRRRLGCYVCRELCKTKCPRTKEMVCSKKCHKKLWNKIK